MNRGKSTQLITSLHLFKSKRKYTAISTLCQQDGSITNDPYEKATSFNNFFLDYSKQAMSGATLSDTNFLTTTRLTIITFSRVDILDMLKSLDPNKVSGPDCINPKMLKCTAVHVCSSLTRYVHATKLISFFLEKKNVSPLLLKR